MQRKPIQFTANLQSSMVSFTTHDDKEYLVAPCVALVPGVLNRDLVTLEALANTFQAWNGRPVVLDHPLDGDGIPMSANDPRVLASAGLGQVWNADVTGDRLKVDVWLDVAKGKRLGGDAQRVIDAVRSGESVEVSTGYWATMRSRRGVHNEREYDEVTELIIPDHLAMLPNALGACNWGDGCGIPRVNQREIKMDERTLIEVVTDSFRKLIPHLAVQNVATKGMCKACATVHAQADPYETEPISEPEPGPGPTPQPPPYPDPVPQPDPVPEPEPIPDPSQDPDPTTQPHENPIQPTSPEKGNGDNPEEEETVVAQAKQQMDTLQAFLNEMGVSQDDVRDALQVRSNRRQEWVDVIKTNVDLTDDDIKTMSDKVLEQLAKTHAPSPAQQAVVNGNHSTFFGRGLPVSQPTGGKVEPLRRPQVLVNARDRQAS